MERNFARLYSSPAYLALNLYPVSPDEIASAIQPHPESITTDEML